MHHLRGERPHLWKAIHEMMSVQLLYLPWQIPDLKSGYLKYRQGSPVAPLDAFKLDRRLSN